MRKQRAVWRLISNSLQRQIPVMLLYVLQSSGSSPGRQGFLMAVNILGEMKGSIGGGIMEHKFVEMAKEKLNQQTQIIDLKQQFHDKKAAKNQSGMICSGEQTLLLYPIKKTDAVFIGQILECLNANQNGLLRLSPQGLEFEKYVPNDNFFFNIENENEWIYKEKLGYKNHLFIIGGGHCSLALSKLMNGLDFYIEVFDDRSELNTLNENEFAHQKTIVKSYSELSDLIQSGKSNYVVIMTFGYRTDDLALKALLDKNLKYLGILGSQTKIKEMFDSYVEAGIPVERLDQIHSPIGIQIKSQTPEEIAVSIAAEIIQVKNECL